MEMNQDEPNYPQILFGEGVDANEVPEGLIENIVDAVKKVYDPEIPVDIFELGLIYAIEFLELTENNIRVRIDMTLTAPGCPVAGDMPGWVSNAVYSIPEIKECLVDLVWEPFWTPQRMSLRAKLELNML